MIAGTGCIAETEPSGDDGAEPTSTDPTDGAEPTGDSGSDTATSIASETGTGSAVETPWSDVPCGAGVELVNCVGNEVCVLPGADCDTSPCRKGEDPILDTHKAECQPFPEHCGPTDEGCIIDVYCDDGEIWTFSEGFLHCAGAEDCYCS